MIILNKLRRVFENPAIKKIGQTWSLISNTIELSYISRRWIVWYYDRTFLIQPDLKHNLDYLAEIYLNYKMVPIDDLIGKKGQSAKEYAWYRASCYQEYAGWRCNILADLSPVIRRTTKKWIDYTRPYYWNAFDQGTCRNGYTGFKISKIIWITTR